MITAITLCLNHASRVKCLPEINFTAKINTLVGPNGSGKSTILRAIHKCKNCSMQTEGTESHLYFNAETMNPQLEHNFSGDMRNMILRTRALFSSHGEIMKDALTTIPIHKGETLLVDEPETGQDIDGILRIRKGFAAIIKEGGQVIMATHHPLLMLNTNVIELVPDYVEKMHKVFLKSFSR